MIARTGFFVLCSVFKEHDPRELSHCGPARTRCTLGVRQPTNDFAGDNFGYRSNFRMWKPPQERRATLTSGSDQRNSAAQEARTCRYQGVDLPSAAQPPRGGPSKIAALCKECTSTTEDNRSFGTTAVRERWLTGSD